MIADAIYHDDTPPTLYLRWRNDKGELQEETVDDYRPHMYVPIATPEFRLKQLKTSFPELLY